MKTTSKHRKNHAPKLRNSCRNLAQMSLNPLETTRRRRLVSEDPWLDSAAPSAIIVTPPGSDATVLDNNPALLSGAAG